MRGIRGALLLATMLGAGGCAAEQAGQKRTLDQILQDEGSNPAMVPMYLMGPNGTFVTNGLIPEPWGDTGS